MSRIYAKDIAVTALRSVRVGRLAEFITADKITYPCLLKIDVQGYELEVLKGCTDLFGAINYIYVECSHIELYAGQPLIDEIKKYLSTYSYRFVDALYVSQIDSFGVIQSDCLFERINARG